MDHFNDELNQALHIAKSLTKEYANKTCHPEHMLKALFHKDLSLIREIDRLGKDVFFIEEWAEVRIESLPKSSSISEAPPSSEALISAFDEAESIRKEAGQEEIDLMIMFKALATPGVGFSHEQLKSFPVNPDELPVNGVVMASSDNGSPAAVTRSVASKNLSRFCTDKLAEARQGKFDQIVGRDHELRMVAEILGRMSKPNVMLIGEPGVGKTSLLEGFAANVVKGKVPEFLKGYKVYELNVAELMAGASYKGEIEDRLKKIITELKALQDCILMVDEIHMILDKQNGLGSAINILKPELAKGDITLIGATTTEEFRKHVERDEAFNRRFEVVRIEEPNDEKALRMLESVMGNFADHHALDVNSHCMEESIRLAKRYTRERRLPDSAIDLLDRTMAVVKLANSTSPEEIEGIEKELKDLTEGVTDKEEAELLSELKWFLRDLQVRVSPVLFEKSSYDPAFLESSNSKDLQDHISLVLNELKAHAAEEKSALEKADLAAVMASKTGVPVGKIGGEERERLQNIEEHLQKRVIGQDHAIATVSEAVRESRSGLGSPNQPMGSFFFLGPTGTGKTELAKTLADFLFYDETAMIRFDMSEFKEEHSAALLYGAPPGYVGYEEGGMLVNKIRETPYAVVLFDEIEKAHPSVFDLFLQILDEGKLHDRLGKEGDFSNALVLFTSNIGSDHIVEAFGKGEIPPSNDLMEIMTNYFRPEFLGRLTEIIPFAPISEENVVKIFDIHLNNLRKILKVRGIELEISEDAKKKLAMTGFTPKYGARPIKGVIRTKIRRPLARMIINEELDRTKPIKIDLDNDENIIWNN